MHVHVWVVNSQRRLKIKGLKHGVYRLKLITWWAHAIVPMCKFKLPVYPVKCIPWLGFCIHCWINTLCINKLGSLHLYVCNYRKGQLQVLQYAIKCVCFKGAEYCIMSCTAKRMLFARFTTSGVSKVPLSIEELAVLWTRRNKTWMNSIATLKCKIQKLLQASCWQK